MTSGRPQPGLLLDQLSAVLFDLDGTLLDTAPDLVNALEILCAEQKQPAPEHKLACRYVSTGAIGLVRLGFPNQSPDREETLRQRLVDIYADNLSVHTVIFSGMETVLTQLESAGTPWGIVTNKQTALTEPLLEQLGLRSRCATVVSGDSTANRKPHPDPVLLALKELGISPLSAAYVGDASQDIFAGKAAGTVTVAVTWGYILPNQDPRSWEADYTIDHPEQILTLSVPACT